MINIKGGRMIEVNYPSLFFEDCVCTIKKTQRTLQTNAASTWETEKEKEKTRQERTRHLGLGTVQMLGQARSGQDSPVEISSLAQ